MRTATREKFDRYQHNVAVAYGVDQALVTSGKKFAATPSVEQTIHNHMQESSDFLRRVNMPTPTEQVGEKIGLGIGSTIASNTDTTTTDRATQDPHTTDAEGYQCAQTNFDTHLRYSVIDQWAKFADFETRLRNAIIQRQALDLITMGFNGTSRAATSNRATNPLLQDVAKGWLQKLRDNAAARVMDGVKVGEGPAAQDYKNLDSLVFDMVNSLIEPWHQEDPELVCVMGRQLLSEKLFPIIDEHGATPTEANASQLIISSKRVGGLPAVRVPYFPARGIMVTRLDNLSIYMQEGTRRRTIVDNAKRDQIENYESVNLDFVIEDYEGACMAENILMPDAAGTAWA